MALPRPESTHVGQVYTEHSSTSYLVVKRGPQISSSIAQKDVVWLHDEGFELRRWTHPKTSLESLVTLPPMSA